MSMMEEAKLNGKGVYAGGQQGPTGSYWNPATNAIFQQSSDGVVQTSVNTWILITTSGSSTLSQCATAINGIISGLAYTSSNLHAYSSADNSTAPGTGANDA